MKELSRNRALESIPVMRSREVVEVHEGVERDFELTAGREVAAPKDDAPMLVKDRALQALDKAVGPAVTRLGARVANVEAVAGLVEVGLEFVAMVAEDPLELPPGRVRRTCAKP